MTETNDNHQWKRMRFKRNKVWMALNEEQQPLVENGKVLIKYQLDQSHQYWVHSSNVHPLDDPLLGQQTPGGRQTAESKNKPAAAPDRPQDEENAIRIYTDGACSGNPGPAGIGVVMIYKDKRKEISHPMGMATNNLAELEAIRQGLSAVKNRNLPVILYTDSSYAMGVLIRGWQAKRHQTLVAQIQSLLKNFKQVKFIKVKGHAGHPENERADKLAVKAIEHPTSS